MTIFRDGGASLDANPENTAIYTYTERVFDVLDPRGWDFHQDDIAHALSCICRYAGHVEFYSVAEHSIRVAERLRSWGAPPDVELLGLLHDASEAYLLDIPRPIKGLVSIGGRSYYDVEDELQEALFEWQGLLDTYDTDWDMVKEADLAVYEEERESRPAPTRYRYLGPLDFEGLFIQRWSILSTEIERITNG